MKLSFRQARIEDSLEVIQIVKIFLFPLIVIIFFSSAFGQNLKSKVFSPDNVNISTSIFQKREITKYLDGGAFRCGFSSLKGECDYEKIRKVIWQCWSEKTLCYLTIRLSGIDAGLDQYIFIEPNKNNRWLVVRREENYHAMRQYRKPIHNLPTVYSLEWRKDKDEQVLVFKNRLGKVIEEF
jgi:hypothetical protein